MEIIFRRRLRKRTLIREGLEEAIQTAEIKATTRTLSIPSRVSRNLS